MKRAKYQGYTLSVSDVSDPLYMREFGPKPTQKPAGKPEIEYPEELGVVNRSKPGVFKRLFG